jgi:acyl transferase domain-containing protein/NAD(P)-dependent dehydrogenase (short-subunit alcohol dehydrogenase family)
MTIKQSGSIPVAIIGIGCIFAKCEDQKSFYHLISRGIDGITGPPESHSHLQDYFDPDPKKPDHIYCNKGGYIPLTAFDPTEFSIPPNVIEATDTSQLLSLITAKRALEDAGYGENGKPFDRSKASVIIGVTGTQELVIPLSGRLGHPIWRQALKDSGISNDHADDVIHRISNGYVEWQENSFPGLLGNVVAGRIANRLDLGGTNCVVDAACASSMGAIHLALLELQSGRSDMVLTGGADTINDAFMHMCFSKTQILSPSGDIRPFSEDADGTVLGEGIGIVILKRLVDAEQDGDRIYAVIRGLGSASDGRSQSIYAPRSEGQSQALRRAYSEAGIDPASVKLVEAHGTGTRVGDQVEFQALCDVFGTPNPNGNGCALGSVKSNIGHTKAAAGAAGLIKTALSIYHKILPPTLKAAAADPKLGIEKSPFYLNSALRPWVALDAAPRTAGVSAFGFGGSNFHAVLQEHRETKLEPSWDGTVEIAAFSADSRPALQQMVESWAKAAETEPSRHRIAKLSRESRSAFNAKDPQRLVMVMDIADGFDAVIKSCNIANDRLSGGKAGLDGTVFFNEGCDPGGIAFLFPGQGSQYVGMGRDLICCFPESLSVFQDAARAFGKDQLLEDCIFPRLNQDPAAAELRLRRTDIAQPAIGAVSAAMLNALTRFGVTPDATVGHSYGELVALHAAGWITASDLWRLSLERGRLMAEAGRALDDPGTMLAVMAPVEDIAVMVSSLNGEVVLANRNSLSQGVLSGAGDAIAEAESECRRRRWRSVKLPVAAAFHSPLVADALGPFFRSTEKTTFSPGQITVMSNARGKSYPTEPGEIRQTLSRQLAHPVDFLSNVQSLHRTGIKTFVEIGPKTVLSQLVHACLDDPEVRVMAVDQSSGSQSGIADLANVVGKLAVLGYPVKLQGWEKPKPEVRASRMTIPLSGSNYRRPKAPVPPKSPQLDMAAAGTAVDIETRPPAATAKRALFRGNGAASIRKETPPAPDRQTVGSGSGDPAETPKEALQDAFSAVQQGLAALQSLQAQTVRAHEKFLDTQAEASKTLQMMMRSAQQLVAIPEGTRRSTVSPVGDKWNAEAPTIAETPPIAPLSSNTPPLPADSLEPVSGPASGPDNARLQQTLVDIVAELTGYPAEMLGLQMDIESDLGIDSIKRVEILSALEEKMPHLPKVTPDMMGTLRTLEQICDHLSSGSGNRAPAPEISEPVSGPASGPDNARLQQTLVDIVAELTGYPAEMLGLQMDIESDLGIDSIKRVEILSALEEKMPHLPKVTPDMMGTLRTLEQICDHLSSGSGNRAPAPEISEPVSGPASGPDNARLQQTLVDIVAELTGYPAEMLGLQMDIESDLGIDSIKRVEILSALEEKMPHLPKVTPDMMGTLRTLEQICDHLSSGSGNRAPAPEISEPDADRTPALHLVQPMERHKVARQLVRTVSLERVNRPVRPESLYRIGIVCEDETLRAALKARLASDGHECRTIRTAMDMEDGDLLSGLLLLAPLSPRNAFEFAQKGAPSLIAAAKAGGAFFMTAAFLDGAFGFKKERLSGADQGALAGLVKTAAIEWSGVRCRALDIDPSWTDSPAVADAIAAEIATMGAGELLEVGLSRHDRLGLALFSNNGLPGFSVELDGSDVVVVTGGARGVTAAAAQALAENTNCKLALLGRSAEPVAEPQWLDGLKDTGQIKKAILASEFAGQSPSPRDIERRYRKWMANREILSTLAALDATGALACYYRVDICDSAMVETTVARIHAELGPISGLIHGAGILRDRLILDKTVDQFNRVYDTKVLGLENLLDAIDRFSQSDLSHIVLFSSVSARMGNQGQADYAMANEVLNKRAQQLSRSKPGCKVIAINWGPWDGGMVTPALKRRFTESGIDLIPLKAGAAAMVAEMSQPDNTAVEILIGSPLSQAEDQPAGEHGSALREDFALMASLDIDIQNYPVLKSHYLDGRPVVPLAIITEWLAHGALHANPGLILHGIDNLRVLKGIQLDSGKAAVSLMAGRARRVGRHYAVDVEIRNNSRTSPLPAVHSKGTVMLTDTLPGPPPFIENGHFKDSGIPRNLLDRIYGDILFHGKDLHGIREILQLSEKGMSARLSAAPPPADWIIAPLRSRWIADPLILDSAFQMAIVWCKENLGKVSLPSYAASYRQYSQRFPADGVSAVLEVSRHDERKMRGDFTFLDSKKAVVARISGYEAIMDPLLVNAFKAA